MLRSDEFVYDATWGDYDNDGDPDLFTISYDDDRANNLYKNNGDETFTKITSGLIANDNGHRTSCSWVDYNNDGWLDLLAANEGI